MSDFLTTLGGFVLTGVGVLISVGTLGGGATLGAALISVGTSLISMGLFGLPQFQSGIKANVTSTQAALPVVYGEAKVGHVNTDMRQDNSNDDVLDIVGAICVGSENGAGIHSIDQIDFGNRLAATISEGVFNNTTDGTITGKDSFWVDDDGNHLFRYNLHPGSDAQTVDLRMNDEHPTAWPSTSTGKGIAYSVLRLFWDDTDTKRFSGIPQITYTLRGNLVYDPRDVTGGPNSDGWIYDKADSGYSFVSADANNPGQNPSLVLYDYLTSNRYGVGIPDTLLDTTSFTDQADHCDESVSLTGVTGSPTQARYTLNGALSTGDDHKTNIEKILSSMNANLLWKAGQIAIMPRKSQTPETFEFTDDNILGEISVVRSGSATPNTVRARYPDANEDWNVLDVVWPEPGSNSFLDVDNSIESEHVIDLPLTTNYNMAQHLIQLVLKELREDVTVELTATEESLELEPGNVVRLTYDSAGWTQKEFRVMNMKVKADSTVAFTLREYDSAVYNLNESDQPTVPGTGLPDPSSVAAPTGLNLTSDDTTLIQTDDGTVQPRVKAEWTKSTGPFLDREVVQWNLLSPTNWIHLDTVFPSEDKTVLTPPLSEGTNVDIRVIAYNTLGVASTPVSDSITATGKAGAPEDVTGLVAKYNTVFEPVILLNWNNVTDNDLSHYEVRYGGTGWADATVIGERVDTTYLAVNVEDIGSRSTTFRVKAFDRTGNESANADTVAWSDTISAVTPTSTSSRVGSISMSVDVATTTDSTGFNVYASTTSGFTPGPSNLKQTVTYGNNGTTAQKAGFPLEDGWDSQTVYMVLGFFDKLSEVLGEGPTLSTEFSETGVDPTGGDPNDVTPIIDEDIIYTVGSGQATLRLDITDPNGLVTEVGFTEREGSKGASWPAYDTTDITNPYEYTVTLSEIHSTYVRYRVTYNDINDGVTSRNIVRTVTFDRDFVPELSAFNVGVNDSGDAILDWAGDDDVDHIRWKVATTTGGTNGYPSLTNDDVDGTLASGRIGPVDTTTDVSQGDTVWAIAYAYNSNGDPSSIAYRSKATRPTDTDNNDIPPTVVEDVYTSTTASTGQLDLDVDWGTYATGTVYFNTKSGIGAWSGFTSDAAPYSTTVALSEKHNSFIAYRVEYDGATKNIESTVTFDVDQIPELASLGISVDDSGDVDLFWSGDDDVESISYDVDLANYPGGTVNPENGRTGTAQIYTGLAEGSTLYVNVRAHSGTGGGGSQSSELYEVKVTRPTDTDNNDIAPSIQTDVSNTTTTTGQLDLTVDWGSYSTGTVRFKTKSGLAAWPGTWTADTAPYSTTVALSEKHNSYIAYQVEYGASKFIEDVVTFDVDENPELTSLDADVDDAGNVEFSYAGDDDVTSIKYHTDTTNYPTRNEVQTSGTVPPTDARNDELSVGSITEGQTMYISVLAYTGTGASGTESILLYRTKVTRPTDTDTQRDPFPPVRTVWNGDFRKGGFYWESADNYTAGLETTSPISGPQSLKLTSSTGGGMSMRNTSVSESFTNQAKEDWALIPVNAGDKVLVSLSYDTPAQLVGFKVNALPKDLSGNVKHTFFTIPSGTGTRTDEWVVPDDGTRYLVVLFECGADSSVRDYIIDNIELEVIPGSIGELDDWPGGIARTSGRINDNDLLKNLPKNFVTVSGLEDGDDIDFSGTGLDLDFDAAPKWAVAKYGKSYEPDSGNWTAGFSSSTAQRMLVELIDLDADGATVRAVLQQPPTQTTETTAGSSFETGSENPMTAVGHNQRKAINNLPATNDDFTVKFDISVTGGGDGGGSGGAWYEWQVDIRTIGSNVVRETYTFTLFISGTLTTTDSATVNITASDMTADLADDIEIEVKSGPTFISGNFKQIISSWEIDADDTAFVEHQYAAAPEEAVATDAGQGITVAFRLWDEA